MNYRQLLFPLKVSKDKLQIETTNIRLTFMSPYIRKNPELQSSRAHFATIQIHLRLSDSRLLVTDPILLLDQSFI
jgi:hypothetical protein